eukprot:gene9371-7053_t
MPACRERLALSLTQYFADGFLTGLEAPPLPGYGAVPDSDVQAETIRHRRTGIEVAADALNLCPKGYPPSRARVLYHYTSKDGINAIMTPGKKLLTLFASLDQHCAWGKGLYVSQHAPDHFVSKWA